MLAIGGAVVSGGGTGPLAFALAAGTAALLVGLLLLGAGADAGPGWTWVAFLGTGLWVVAGFGVVLLLPPESPESPRLLLGLPLRAGILVYGVGLAPAIVLPWVYGVVFDRETLTGEAWAELRDAASRSAEGDGSSDAGGRPPGSGPTPDGGGG